MNSISEQDEKHIQEQPLETALHEIRSAFAVAGKKPTGGTSSDETDVASRQDAISNLLGALLIHPVARRLRSAPSQRPVNGELASIYARAQSDGYDLSPFSTLVNLVANAAEDVKIWKAVLQLISDLSRTTPPRSRSIPPSFYGTPFVRSSASFQDSNQTRSDLQQPLVTELSGSTFEDVTGFFSKYFEARAWTKKSEDIYSRLQNRNDGNPLSEFPQIHSEDQIWDWWDMFQQQHLDEAPRVYCRTKSKKEVQGAEGERQLDLIVKCRSTPRTQKHDVKDFLVIGELTSSDKSTTWKRKFLQLATYMRDIFSAQPTRRFVHGFLLFGTQMQLWIFDRSGAYSSETFDILQRPDRFIRTITGYALMTDEDLGLDTFMKRDGQHPSVAVADATTGEDVTLKLEASPFIIQRAIVSRGTLCYRTADQQHVVKFSWRSDKRRPEADHLKRSQGVKGIAKLVGSSDVTSVADLRSGLTFPKPRKLGNTPYEALGDASKLSFTSQSTQELESLSLNGTKRKHGSEDRSARKKSKSNSQRSNLRQELMRHDFTELSQEHLSTLAQREYKNRILTCLAISPAGRPLMDFNSVGELLKAFRDVIKAHKSLFLNRKILHRDVSLNNIILTDPKQTGGLSGMLIDFDLAVSICENGKNERTEEQVMTGTLEYIAMEILEGALRKDTAGIEHTYRHDLESFFYVFLSVCIRYGWEDGMAPNQNLLSTWYTGEFENIYRAKRGDIEPGGFDILVLRKFSPTFECVKGLARTFRDILFLKGALYTGTPQQPASLYNPIIKAFEGAIESLEW